MGRLIKTTLSRQIKCDLLVKLIASFAILDFKTDVHDMKCICLKNMDLFTVDSGSDLNFLMIFMPPQSRPAGDIERSGCSYVRTSIQQEYTKIIAHMSRSTDCSIWPHNQL